MNARPVYLNLTLPASYSKLTQIKENSYPYTRSLMQFLTTLSAVQSQTDYDFFQLVGAIEAKLGSDFPLGGGEQVRFALRVTDETAITFLRTNAQAANLTLKDVFRRLLQLVLRLSASGYSSFDAMTFVIDDTFAAAKPVVKPKVKQKPALSGVRVKKAKQVKEPAPTPKPKPKPAPNDVIAKSEAALAKLEKRNQQIQKFNQEASHLGETVKTNSLLNDFM